MTNQKKTINIALFASGSGTNVENILNKLKDEQQIEISCLICNNPDAYVLTRAKNHNLDFLIIDRKDFLNTDRLFSFLESHNVNLIVLAGFLWLIPSKIVSNYKIINIHPALLPKYGGKGMFGEKVHEAVYNNKEKESGITIHFVNDKYDEGQIIFQKSFAIEKDDSPIEIAEKVHKLEYAHFPEIIKRIASGLIGEENTD